MTVRAERSRLLNRDPCRRSRALLGVLSVLLIACLTSGLVSARPGSTWRHPYAGKKHQRIVGLLEVASIFRPDKTDVDVAAGIPTDLEQPIRAYARPSTDAAIIALLRTTDDIETRNDPYQRAAAAVFDVNGDWYLIGVKTLGRTEKAWVTAVNGNAFSWLDIVIMVADYSCYVTDSWDHRIWASPSANAKFRRVAKLGTKDFNVTDSNWNGDELWLEVEFSERVNCDWEELPPILAKGWIRAYSATEEMQVWFHPRLDC
jgi:hypothetical protein